MSDSDSEDDIPIHELKAKRDAATAADAAACVAVGVPNTCHWKDVFARNVGNLPDLTVTKMNECPADNTDSACATAAGCTWDAGNSNCGSDWTAAFSSTALQGDAPFNELVVDPTLTSPAHSTSIQLLARPLGLALAARGGVPQLPLQLRDLPRALAR